VKGATQQQKILQWSSIYRTQRQQHCNEVPSKNNRQTLWSI